ncbi:MAG: anthranilate phosphoribosyltransferase, partial [Solirubrobacterales bacterium]
MPDQVLTRAIDRLASGEDLDAGEVESVLTVIMEGGSDEVQTAGFLIALRTKGETVEELAGMARTMRRLATPVTPERQDVVDTAGTGGGPSTINASTIAALVAAGAGCAVAKHGNRSNTSLCGSADLLEELGVPIDLTPDEIAASIDQVGFGFMFAPLHHEATRYVVPVRKALGVRTVFNLLGPLTNPAAAKRQVVGVSDREFQETVAGALSILGSEHALVVSAEDGTDEIALTAPTRIFEVREGEIEEWSVEPSGLGLREASPAALAGGSPAVHAAARRRGRSGEASAGRGCAGAPAAGAVGV